MPFAEYRDWEDCLAKTKRAHPDWGEERCARYCGAIKHKTEGDTRSASRRQPRRNR